MKFAKYWARGETVTKARMRNPVTGALGDSFSCWGWSDVSLEDARIKGGQRTEALLERIRLGKRPERYPYCIGPIREEVLREFRDSQGGLTAAVTRNSYGCLVLNTAGMMFVDVDEPEEGLMDVIAAWFRPKKESLETRLLADTGRWLASRPEWGWRIYRTAAGMRLLATHRPFAPEAPECQEAFDAFGADPLYRTLCSNQKCFRARLTPKPWRCDIKDPALCWPWPDAKAQSRFADWDRRYLSAASKYSTCRLVGHFGHSGIHPELRDLISFHDAATRVDSQLPLA